MPHVYLINIGANTQHQATARSPIFPDGSFVFVSFPTTTPQAPPGYTDEAQRFTHGVDPFATHADPDWANLTYGDYCHNARARALLSAERGDLLLFWGLLWGNNRAGWRGFDGTYGWYLLGVLQVAETVTDQMALSDVPELCRRRASANAHFAGSSQLERHHRVFVGNPKSSSLFTRAVPLGVSQADGLLYQAFRSAQGHSLSLNGKPRWNSSLRSCRRIFDMSNADDLARFTIVRRAVIDQAGFDMLGSC